MMVHFKLLMGLILTGLVVVNLPTQAVTPAKSLFLSMTQPLVVVVHKATRGVSQALRAGQPDGVPTSPARKARPTENVDFEVTELRTENARLRRLLELRERKAGPFRKVVAAEVIGRTPGGWRDTLIVNKGRHDGIQRDMPVMAEGGLLGKIVEVTPFTSKVKLLTHPRIRVGALVQRTRHIGVVYGTADGGCRMKYLPMDADVAAGDKVQTAPFSHAFPKGLLIGEIIQVWKEPGQLYKVASIKLAADTHRLEEVLCVDPS